jgi:hypothetical protein
MFFGQYRNQDVVNEAMGKMHRNEYFEYADEYFLI